MIYSQSNSAEINKEKPDYLSLQPFFNYLPVDIIKKTFSHNTQYARTPASTLLKNNFKSPFLVLNVSQYNEPVATDTVFSDTPAIDNISTSAQFFSGTEILLTDAYGIKLDKKFVNNLEDNIQRREAMDKLASNRAQVEISRIVKDILRSLFIDD